jgi:formylglycine-generating enzyme required for sulfatase activity
MTLLYVPAGEFTMGSDADDAVAECQKIRSFCPRDWFTDEEPPHSVHVDDFWIDQTEVTNTMYAKCVADGICKEPTDKSSNTHPSYYGNPEFDDYPVIHVDWNMAKTYCEWAGRRLPTEAEWEKAALGLDGRTYPWGEDISCSLANYWGQDGGCVGDTTEVGSYMDGASAYGALDMSGNVSEWVQDWYDAYPGSTVSDPYYGTTYRVLRGGAWDYLEIFVRADRSKYVPAITDYNLGFRCSRSP